MRYHTILTAHLADNNILDVALNGALTFWVGGMLDRSVGAPMMLRLLTGSVLLGSTLLYLKMASNPFYASSSYMGTHVYVRTFIYFLILRQPYYQVQILPQLMIPLYAMGAFLRLGDIMKFVNACLAGFVTAICANILL